MRERGRSAGRREGRGGSKEDEGLICDRHRERARALVGREADDVQPERDRTVERERARLAPRHLGRRPLPHPRELAARAPDTDALDGGERAHAHEEVERVQPQAPDLDPVRDDALERGKERPEEREGEARARERVVAVRRKGDAGDDGDEGEVRLARVALAEEGGRHGDREEGRHRAHDLVELRA